MTRKLMVERDTTIAHRIKLELRIEKGRMMLQKLKTDIPLRDSQVAIYNKRLEKREQLQNYIRASMEKIKKEHRYNVRVKLIDINDRINQYSGQRLRDWKRFQIFFDRIYPQFFEHFSGIFPELKQFEIRLCALLKLNLETKQIASILNTTNEGIKVAKHRLRKKLKLPSDESLITFFNSI
jgi:hypothetical protein